MKQYGTRNQSVVTPFEGNHLLIENSKASGEPIHDQGANYLHRVLSSGDMYTW